MVEAAVEAAEEPATKKKKKRKSGVVTEPEPETPSVEIPVAPADQTPAAGFYFHFINSHGAFLRVSVGYNHREYQGRFYSLKYGGVSSTSRHLNFFCQFRDVENVENVKKYNEF